MARWKVSPRRAILIIAFLLLLCTSSLLQVVRGNDESDGYYNEDAYYSDEDLAKTNEYMEAEQMVAGQVAAEQAAADSRRLELEREAAELAAVEEDMRNQNEQLRMAQQQALLKTTYKRSVGGGLGRVAVLLVNERYLAVTAAQYGCVLQKDLGIKQQAKNATKVLHTVQENEKRRQEDFGKVVLPDEKAAAAAVGSVDGAAPANNAKAAKTAAAQKDKKLTYREVQEQKRADRMAAEAEREALRGKFELGVSCESLVCGSCKAMVEEFAGAVVQGITDPKYVYIEDILPDFCQRKEIALKYTDMVAAICFAIYSDKGGYREAFMVPFENDNDWANVAKPQGLFLKKQQACTAIGACKASHFELALTPKNKQQEHWDHRCYICQAFALDLEERIQLSKGVTDGSIEQVVSETCGRLGLPAKFQALCAPLTVSGLLDDVSWIAKMHHEALVRKAKGEVSFADKLCEEVEYCTRYVDPLEAAQQEVAKMEQVFF